MANLMCDTIGPSPRANVVPGHSGPEDALVKLYLLYRNDPKAARSVSVPVDPKRYLDLAQFFIDARGNFEGRTGKDKSFGDYGQDRVPLAQQTSLEGHAVRATLFCTGIAALADVTDRADYHAAAQRFWDSYINHKTYITGAGGAIGDEEKFGPDYFLPNDGYMETCAAVSSGFFNRAMNLLYGDARYIDELERALYNAVLGGVSMDGSHYYYQNPLTGNGLRRWEWHGCPCCPPMFLKMTGALPGYIYAQGPNAAYVNLFIGSRASLVLAGTQVSLKQTTRYPWEGQVKLAVDPEKPVEFDLYICIPAWCQGKTSPNDLYHPQGLPATGAATLRVNGEAVGRLDMQRGYARLHRVWKTGDVVEVSFAMPVRQVKAHRAVEADAGLVALARGPVVYCIETADNPEGIGQLVVGPKASFTADYRAELLGGVAVLQGKVASRVVEAGKVRTDEAELTAVPFYASANREPGAMRVWMPASIEKAVPASLASQSKATASHCWHLDSVGAVNDGVVPAKSSDTSLPRLSWWDHKDTTEWVELTFPRPTEVSRTRVFWFADRPAGGCDLPKAWRLLYKDGDDRKPVEQSGAYDIAADRFCEVSFKPVETTALRIEVDLQPEWSSGICEWQVE
jgi:uncharacterized protein